MKKLFARLFGNKAEEQVPFYDAKTKKTVLIPKSELSPTSILVRIDGFDSQVYIDASEAKLSDSRLHPPFEGEEKRAIESLVSELADVYPMTFTQWEDGFRCDARPQKEIVGWVHLASILKIMSHRFSFDQTQRRECFQLLVACFNGERSTARNRCKVQLLSDEQADLAIKFWYDGGYA